MNESYNAYQFTKRKRNRKKEKKMKSLSTEHSAQQDMANVLYLVKKISIKNLSSFFFTINIKAQIASCKEKKTTLINKKLD